MKRKFPRIILPILSIVLVLGIAVVSLLDRQAWISGRKLSEALQDAQTVTLVEYTGDREIARKTASADEISQLREAISSWWHPFVPPSGTLSFVPNHRIEAVQRDGSKVTGLISFFCEQFMIDHETAPAPLPRHIRESLSSFFTAAGMAPKTYDEYKALENAEGGSK